MKKIGAVFTALLFATVLVLGQSPSPASAHVPNLASYISPAISFSTAGGTVTCGYQVDSTWGTRASDGHHHIGMQATATFYQGTPIPHCQRNGVSVTGTGAGQFYLIGAWRYVDASSGATAWSYPYPFTSGAFDYQPAASSYLADGIDFALSVCEGGGGSCLFPILKQTPYDASQW